MAAYVVITSDDKQGTVYPSIYGPFPTDAEAEVFAAEVDADQLKFIQIVGGYYGVHVVSDSTALPPSEWAPIDDDEDESEVLNEAEVLA